MRNKKSRLKEKISKLWKYTVVTLASAGGGGIAMFGFLLIMLQFELYTSAVFSLRGLIFWTVCAWMFGFSLTSMTLLLNDEKLTYYSCKNKESDFPLIKGFKK